MNHREYLDKYKTMTIKQIEFEKEIVEAELESAINQITYASSMEAEHVAEASRNELQKELSVIESVLNLKRTNKDL